MLAAESRSVAAYRLHSACLTTQTTYKATPAFSFFLSVMHMLSTHSLINLLKAVDCQNCHTRAALMICCIRRITAWLASSSCISEAAVTLFTPIVNGFRCSVSVGVGGARSGCSLLKLCSAAR